MSDLIMLMAAISASALFVVVIPIWCKHMASRDRADVERAVGDADDHEA